MRSVTVEWSYPVELDHILQDDRMQNIGIYYITRRFGNRVSDLYIGKTIHSFGSRLESHRWFWTDDYRGKKEVRLECTLSCSPSQRIRIINTGYRGNLLPEMYISAEDWIA